MGACGCTSINNGLIVPAVLRGGWWWWWWSADGSFDEPGMMGLDRGDEWVAEDAEELLEILEVVEVEETEEWGRSAGCWVVGMDV